MKTKLDTVENNTQIKALKEKLEELTNKLQDKIEKLNIIIDRYTQKIDEIKNDLADINKQYANMISDLFKNKIKLSTTQLNLVISPKIQQLIGETKLPASIELDAKFQFITYF